MTKYMKILHVTSSFKPSWELGGVVKVAYDLSLILNKQGHDITVYTTDYGRKRLNVTKNKIIDIDGISVCYFKNFSNYLANMNIFTPYLLLFVAKREIKKFDVIHIHGHRSFLAVIICHYARKYGVPYIIQAHGSLPYSVGNSFKKLFDIIWGNRILNESSLLLALTSIEVEQYKSLGCTENKIRELPNGININEFNSLPIKGSFKTQYNIPEEKKIILFLGRINIIKGLDLLIDAFNVLIQELDNVMLVIAGPDAGYLHHINEKIIKLHLSDHVVITGPLYKKSKHAAYVDADVYVLPSIYETFPMTVLEAWACGTPVVISESCALSPIIFKEQSGIVVKREVKDVVNAMRIFLTNDEARLTYIENGRILIETVYNWEKILKVLKKFYNLVRYLD